MLICDDIEKKLETVRNNPYYIPLINAIKAEYDKTKGTQVSNLDFSTFKLFTTTGDREAYEARYYERRKRLTWSVILYLLYGEQEYMDEICNMVWIICAENTWVLPAHLHIENCKVSEYRTYIDLFAAETGFYLAELNCLLKDKLPPMVSEMIECQVKERILDSYESRTFWWETLDSNWSAVCAGSVAMTYMYASPERFEQVKSRLLASMDCFLSGYGDDGCCGEGISYWQYGFGYFIQFADMYYRYTNGKCDLRDSEKVRNIAKFLSRIFLKNNTVVSFADGVMYSQFIDIGLVSYLCKNFPDVSMTQTVLKITNSSFPHKLSVQLRNLFWSEPELLQNVNKVKEGMEYFPDAKWYIVKKKDFAFAAKAGHNDEGHNHNDIGGFIIADDLGQVIADIGAMAYTRDNFNENRYKFLQNSSFGHSVPIIDGKPQHEGKEYFSKVLEVSDNKFALEMHKAYNTEIDKITREFEVTDEGVILTDTYSDIENHSIVERFVSVIEPQITEDGVKIGDVLIVADGKAKISVEQVARGDSSLLSVYLTDYEVQKNIFSVKFIKQR